MASATPFLTAVAGRRSIYTLSKESPIPNSRILEIVNHALVHAPSPFNSRTTRCIVLFGEEHDKLWKNAYEVTEEQTPGSIAVLGPKIKGFQEGYGTVGSPSISISILYRFIQNIFVQHPLVSCFNND